jgi:predicted TIM-barrel fold metal-dependent hydrolase
MNDAANTHGAWLAQVHEEALEPELPICDAHHHLWLDEGHTGWPYTLDDLHRDTGSGHNVVRTVFLECGAQYRTEGPAAFRPVGETEFVAAAAGRRRTNAAIVSSASSTTPRRGLDARRARAASRHPLHARRYKPLAMDPAWRDARRPLPRRVRRRRRDSPTAMCHLHQIPEFVTVTSGLTGTWPTISRPGRRWAV